MKTPTPQLLALFAVLIASIIHAEDYIIEEWSMREVAPCDSVEATETEPALFRFSSAYTTDKEHLTTIYEHPDSIIYNESSWLLTFEKSGADSLRLSTLESRLLKIKTDSAEWFRSTTSGRVDLTMNAYAQEALSDSVAADLRVELSLRPGGIVGMVIDEDTLGGVRMLDKKLNLFVQDSVGGGSTLLHSAREWYCMDATMPIARELTDVFVAGNDTLLLRKITLLAPFDEIEKITAPESSSAGGRKDGISLLVDQQGPETLQVELTTLNEEGEIFVYDILGRQLAAPKHVHSTAGSMMFKTFAPLPGVYFVSFISEKGSKTVKMIR